MERQQYEIRWSGRAGRQFGKLPPDHQQKIKEKVEALVSQPRPASVKALKGGGYRVPAVGDLYRVVYDIDDGAKVVTVTRVGTRESIY